MKVDCGICGLCGRAFAIVLLPDEPETDPDKQAMRFCATLPGGERTHVVLAEVRRLRYGSAAEGGARG